MRLEDSLLPLQVFLHRLDLLGHGCHYSVERHLQGWSCEVTGALHYLHQHSDTFTTWVHDTDTGLITYPQEDHRRVLRARLAGERRSRKVCFRIVDFDGVSDVDAAQQLQGQAMERQSSRSLGAVSNPCLTLGRVYGSCRLAPTSCRWSRTLASVSTAMPTRASPASPTRVAPNRAIRAILDPSQAHSVHAENSFSSFCFPCFF